MITIKNIKKSFGSLEVLKGIDLSIEKGEIVSIVGPSGAGKTTLLQIIGTLDRPDSGSVPFYRIGYQCFNRRTDSWRTVFAFVRHNHTFIYYRPLPHLGPYRHRNQIFANQAAY